MPERPPKEWFDKTVREIAKDRTITDPKAVAGWLWYHGMTPEAKRSALSGERRSLDPKRTLGKFKRYKKQPLDLEELPKPIDIRGYDHTVVRLVPDIDNLIEINVRLPARAFDEVLEILEDSEDIELTDDGKRIVRRGKDNPATNIFIDRE